jgi:hypothetical protein
VKLRIARKMDMGYWKRRKRDDRRNAKRPWWSVYSDDQLKRAHARLRKSWLHRSPPAVDGMRNVRGTDYFAMYRVESRMIRQRTLKREWPDKYNRRQVRR